MRVTATAPLDASEYGFAHHVRVRFADTDAMGVVYHAAYLPYLESARVEYLRAIGHDYVSVLADGAHFAVIEIAVQYLRPCYFDDLVTVHTKLAHCTRATFQMAYLATVGTEARLTAVTVHSCVDGDGKALRLPQWLTALA